MALTSSNAVQQLSDGNSQGTVMGQETGDLIGFYGTDPVAQEAITGGTALSTAVSSTNAFGFGNEFTASTIALAVQHMVTIGLIS